MRFFSFFLFNLFINELQGIPLQSRQGSSFSSSSPSSSSSLSKNSIVMTMMIRDEAVNIKSNLPLWREVIDYFVFMIDERTKDDTEQAIQQILDNKRPYKMIKYRFEGFGPARTLSLQNAWKFYSKATHVWIADPDWKPDLTTIDKNELDLVHDAFRFIVYDRNGLTTRRCDWLLRHREGLAMKYHLHEVLDIGPTYSPIPVKFIVHEIEQSGSWHTTVGHGHSMSAARYKFDLELLAKDLELYGHNPHTHHYLGISHQAYAEGLFKMTGQMTPEIMDHFNQSIFYFKKRIMEYYEPEFIEERWACMFSLGGLYAQYLSDPVNGLRWLKACHDFSPKQTECAYAMVQIYESQGDLNQVVRTLEVILQTEYEERGMLNHFKHWICDVPVLTVRIYNYLFQLKKNFTSGDAKYMLLVGGMAQSKKCMEHSASLPSIQLQNLQQVANSYGLNSFTSKPELLCNDPELQRYIRDKKYQLHPCENIRRELLLGKICIDFSSDLVAPVESVQIDSHGEFIGAGSLYDIIHHCHAGSTARLFNNPDNGGLYRVLFAQYFNVRNVLSLISFSQKHNLESRLHITIVSSTPEIQLQIQETVRICHGESQVMKNLKFIHMTPGKSFRDLLRVDGSLSNYFDYIEYNGGVSLDPNYPEHLSDLKKMIGTFGVIGLTVFHQNVYQERISQLVSSTNSNAHIPFSQDKTNIVKAILESVGLESYSKDHHLVTALALPGLKSFSKNEIQDLVTKHQLKIHSWLPTALMNPYEMIDYDEVQKYLSYGMSQQDFIESIVTPFRVVVYLSSEKSNLPGVVFPSITHFNSRYIVIDRIGGLAKMFETAELSAKSSLSLTYQIPITSRRESKNVISVIGHPIYLACFSHLTDRKSLSELLQYNKMASKQVSEEILKHSMISGLHLLFSFNYLTLWLDGSVRSPVDNNIPKNREESNLLVLESGLTMRKKSKSEEVPSKSLNNQRVSPTSSPIPDGNQNSPDAIPPICKISGMSGGPFCAAYRNKKGVEASPVSTAEPNEPPPPQPKFPEEPVESRPSNDNMDTTETKIQKLKKMGFTADIIDKILSSSRTQAQTKVDKTTAPDPVVSSTSQLPSICNIPGVNSERLCKAFQQKAGQSMPNPKENKVPLKQKGLVSLERRPRRVNLIDEYQPQTKEMLLTSFRNPQCVEFSKQINQQTNNCIVPFKMKRTSSGITTTSRAKIKFDLDQLNYIHQSTKRNLEWPDLEKARENVTLLLQSVANAGVLNAKTEDAVIVLTSAQKIYGTTVTGRVIHLSQEISHSAYTQIGALDHIGTMMKGIENMDFLVVDGILFSKVIPSLVDTLFMSTIWFDLSTGNTFVAHSDDGLIYKPFHQLGKELEDYLSPVDSRSPFLLKKYFAVAVDLSTPYISPLILGESDNIHVVIWLNGDTTTDAREGSTEDEDGIKVMGIDYTNCLLNHGIDINVRSHPDFATKMGSLKMGTQPICDDQVHEFVSQRSNRLVLFGPGVSFTFSSGTNKVLHPQSPMKFTERIVFALVYIFTRTE